MTNPKPESVICVSVSNFAEERAVDDACGMAGSESRQGCRESRLTRFGLLRVSVIFYEVNRIRYLRHPHRKAFDHYIVVEGFENILREQTVVNARVLVLLQPWKFVLSNVHHYEWAIAEVAAKLGGGMLLSVGEGQLLAHVGAGWSERVTANNDVDLLICRLVSIDQAHGA